MSSVRIFFVAVFLGILSSGTCRCMNQQYLPADSDTINWMKQHSITGSKENKLNPLTDPMFKITHPLLINHVTGAVFFGVTCTLVSVKKESQTNN